MAVRSDQKVALVTGGARGLGFEIARQLARKDMTVVLTARDLDKAEVAAEKLMNQGLDVVAAVADVASDESIRRLASKVATNFGRLDVLVNNAAATIDWREKATMADFERVHRIMETNLFGAWRMVQTFLPLLRKSPHPRIVNVASGAGSHGDPSFGLAAGSGARASYGISKAALIALTSKLAAELKDTGILINAVCPGLTATIPGLEALGARPPQESAAGVVWAATLADNGPTGGFFRDGKRMPW